ncbi:hypothetical protein VCJ_001845 [Vibrio metoecus]|nr:hypothetical protein VCJ_001845 [Vibrio metoecus]
MLGEGLPLMCHHFDKQFSPDCHALSISSKHHLMKKDA